MTDLSKVPDDILLKLVEQRQAKALSSMSDDELLSMLESRKPQRPGVMATIDAGVRGAADIMTFGMADEIAGFMDSITGGKSYDEEVKKQRAIDAADEKEHPVARTVGQIAGGVTGGVGASRAGLSLTDRAIRAGASRPLTVGASALEGGLGGTAYGIGSNEGSVGTRIEDLTWQDPAFGAAGGLVGQMAAPIVQRGVNAAAGAASRMMGRPGPTIVSAEELARNMGVQYRKDAQSGTRGLVDEATGIPLTRGQAAGDFSQIAKEEAMRKDAMGQGAGRIMRQFDTGQEEAIQGAAQRLVGGPGGRSMDDARELVGDIQKGYGAAKTKTQKAYENARLADASVDASMLDKVGSAIRREMMDGGDFIVDELTTPAANRALNDLDKLIPEIPDGKIVGVTAQKLEQARKRLRVYSDAAQSNKADAKAMSGIIKRYDQIVDTLAENGLFDGSEDAINALKVARQARREQGVKFEKQDQYDDSGRFIESVIRGNRSETEVANYLFGKAKIGESGQSVRLVERLKTTFGKDSPQIERIRQGALDRVLYKETGELLGNQAVVTKITDYLEGAGREYARNLHTPEQLKALREFRDAVKKTVPPKGATNPSGTAWALSRLVQSAGQRLMQAMGVSAGGPIGMAAVVAAESVPGIKGRMAAKAATQGGLPIPKLRPMPLIEQSTAGGGFAAGAATQGILSPDEREPLRITVNPR
jgi:hypothetical protein